MKKVSILGLFLILGVMVGSSQSTKSGYLYISSTRYNIRVKNIFRYSLTVSLHNSKESKSWLLAPNEEQEVSGNFSPRTLKNTTISCIYDDAAFYADKAKVNAEVDARNRQKERDAVNNAFWSGVKQWLSGTKYIGPLIQVYDVVTQVNGAVKAANEGTEQLVDFAFDFAKGKAEDAILDELGKKAEKEGLNKNFATGVARGVYEYLQHAGDENRYPDLENYLSGALLLHENPSYKLNRKFNGYTHADYYYTKTKTPNFTLSIEPLIKGNDLNQFWASDDDRLFTDKDGDNELEWSNGLWNKSLGGSFGFAVSPEMKFGTNVYSKLYANIGYHQFGYYMDTTYKLSRNFFATIPANSKTFNVSEPIQFEQRNLSVGLTARFFVKRHLIIDVNGGYMQQSGRLNLYQSKLTSGHTWANEQIKIVEDSYTPFGGFKIGYGYNQFHRGTHFSVGVDFYKTQQANTTAYSITESKSDKLIDFGSNGLHYKVYIGLTSAF